jgi:peptidylprolyl isomerase
VPASRDYYSILQVNPGASDATIDAAYERLSRVYDPETSKKAKAAERRAELEEAYEVLSDPKRRSEYDRLRSRGYRPGQDVPATAHPPGLRGVGSRLWHLLDNPYVFAGIAAAGVVVILVAIVAVSLVGDDDDSAAVVQTSPTASGPLPTAPGTAAPASPPPVTGEEITTDSGLRYVDTVVGTGASPTLGQTVRVNYTGWRESDGGKFDSSLDRGAPSEFVLGEVIQGWNEGLATMKEGGSRRLYIPAALAYGEAGNPPTIPPNENLIFDVDLIAIVVPTATPTP